MACCGVFAGFAIGPEWRAPGTPEADYLDAPGIRYLRLSANSLPMPEEFQARP